MPTPKNERTLRRLAALIRDYADDVQALRTVPHSKLQSTLHSLLDDMHADVNRFAQHVK